DPAGRGARGRGSPAGHRDDRPDDCPLARRLRPLTARRPGGRVGTPLKRVAGGLALAAAAWAAAFRGPRSRFWLRMTLGVGGLGAYALVSEPALRRVRLRGRDITMGFGSAAVLYGSFRLGDTMACRIMPAGARVIAPIYELRTAH